MDAMAKALATAGLISKEELARAMTNDTAKENALEAKTVKKFQDNRRKFDKRGLPLLPDDNFF